MSLYEDESSEDKSHTVQQTGDDEEENMSFCLQVSSAANHAPWIIQRTIAGSVLGFVLHSSAERACQLITVCH